MLVDQSLILVLYSNLSAFEYRAYCQQLDLDRVWCHHFQPNDNKYVSDIYPAQSTYLEQSL